MEFSRPKRLLLGVDMTPLIDCVFNLLLFFLLTSTYLTPTVALNLPRASADKAAPTQAVVVTLTAAQELFLNAEPVSRDELPQRLLNALQQIDQRTVILRADRTLAYEKVLDTILLLQRAGAVHVHLAYEGEQRP